MVYTTVDADVGTTLLLLPAVPLSISQPSLHRNQPLQSSASFDDVMGTLMRSSSEGKLTDPPHRFKGMQRGTCVHNLYPACPNFFFFASGPVDLVVARMLCRLACNTTGLHG